MLKNALWLFVFTVTMLAVFIPSYAKMQDLKVKNRDYARRIEELQKRNAELQLEQHLLETDPAYLEKVARNKMGLIRNGETVYKVVPADKMPKAAPVKIQAQGAVQSKTAVKSQAVAPSKATVKTQSAAKTATKTQSTQAVSKN